MKSVRSDIALSISSVEADVLKVIRYVFAGQRVDKNEFKNTDWHAVFEELKAQAMAAAAVDAVVEAVSEELFNEWLMYSVRVMSYSENILYNQSELTELLKENGIPAATLKGSAAACYYPDPLYRNTSDIDILTEPDDVYKAIQVMKDHGYETVHELSEGDHHAVMSLNGITYEIHREPGGIAHNEKGDVIRDIFKGSVAYSQKCVIAGYEFNRLPRLQNGTVLLLHIVNHLDYGLGLRQLCDWMAFVKAELTSEVWEQEFKPVLKKAGLEKLALTATELCIRYLGLDGDVSWCECSDPQASAELIRHIFNSGNFGSKVDDSLNIMDSFSHTKGWDDKPALVRFFVNIQNTGLSQWKACRKYRVLRSVAWAYVILRYIGRLITGKRKLVLTKDFGKRLSEQKSLHEKLLVYR